MTQGAFETGAFEDAIGNYQTLREQAIDAFNTDNGSRAADLMLEAINAFEHAIHMAGKIVR